MYKKIVWPSLVVISIGLMVIFIVGGFIALNISKGQAPSEEVTPIIEPKTKEVASGSNGHILVLGDSIGVGVGDDGTKGIGTRYSELVDPEGTQNIQVINLAVSGAVVSELRTLVNQPEYVPEISEASLIIISIGGNDLNAIEDQDTSTIGMTYTELLDGYKEDFNLIIQRIRQLNPKAQLVMVGLYDPYGNENPQKTRLLLDWNYETRLMAYEDGKMSYIPTYEVFENNLALYLTFDNFHPSGEGYRMITELLYDILNGSTSL